MKLKATTLAQMLILGRNQYLEIHDKEPIIWLIDEKGIEFCAGVTRLPSGVVEPKLPVIKLEIDLEDTLF